MTISATAISTPHFHNNLTVIANRYAAHLRHLSLLNPHHCPLLPRLRVLHGHILTSGFKPRSHILNRLMELYSKSDDLASARHLFDESPHPDIVGRTTLINAYFNFGDHMTARKIFDATPLFVRDTVSYNSMISGYSRANEGGRAVEVYRDMVREAFRPDDYTLTGLLSAAGAIVNVDVRGCRQLHCAVVKYGTEDVVSVSNALIALYAHCGSSEGISCAGEVFNGMPVKDELTWTTMIVAHVRRGDVSAARDLFDGTTERVGVIWNAMISGYVQSGSFLEALDLFRGMQSKRIPLDEFTYTSVLTMCASSGLYKIGKSVHGHIIRVGPDFDPESALPVKNVLVTLYSKCGKVDNAWKVFVKISTKDTVSWNAMLSGYVNLRHVEDAFMFFECIPRKNLLTWTMMMSCFTQNGFGEEALKLFMKMRSEGVKPCDFVFSGAISACAGLGALGLGLQIHALLLLCGYDSSNSAGNALVTMYAKCGMVEAANSVFDVMPVLDSISWNAMIAALAQHGHGHEAIELFEEMLLENIHPDSITFLTILAACNHAGLVDEGLRSGWKAYGGKGSDHINAFSTWSTHMGGNIICLPHPRALGAWDPCGRATFRDDTAT